MKVKRVIISGKRPPACTFCRFEYIWKCILKNKRLYVEDLGMIPSWCPLEVETDEPKYKLARGVLNWKEGDESAVDAIRRLRDSEDTFNLLPEAPKEVKGE